MSLCLYEKYSDEYKLAKGIEKGAKSFDKESERIPKGRFEGENNIGSIYRYSVDCYNTETQLLFLLSPFVKKILDTTRRKM